MKQWITFPRSVWRNSRKHTDLPRLLTYAVTFKCNARCIMCDSWKMDSHNDLSLPEIKSVFEQLPRMDAVRLTGGEPFLRQDLLDIDHLVQERLKPIMIHITSNGFLTDRIIDFCRNREKSTPLFILLSVDGMRERHNYIRGVKDAWERVTRTIQTLYPQRKEYGLTLAVNQTIVDEKGMNEYEKLREYFKSFNIRINVVMAYETSAVYNRLQHVDLAPREFGQFTTFGDFRSDKIDEFLCGVNRNLEGFPYFGRLAKRYYLRGIRDRLVSGKSNPNPPCVALNSHLRILPDGRIPVCQFNTKTVGDLRKQRFEDIWLGDGIEKHREWVRQCPGCWAECEVLPNAVYSGDIFKHCFKKY